MKKYNIEINVTPELHQGYMAHMWQINLITNEGKYIVAHGWAKTIEHAAHNAVIASKNVK